jgi:type IV pilus assembly protein PilC
VVGPVVRGVHLARLCGSLALLTSARVPLVQAISLVRQMVGFYPVQHSLEQVERDLLAGMSLHGSLSRFPVYDRRLVTLLRVGEESGKLDAFFSRPAAQYSEEVEHRSAVLGSALEPVIIIFLGAVVGLVLMAMYLPLFELGTNLQ